MSSGRLLILVTWLALAPDSAGQCGRAVAEAYLDANDVRARVLGDGSLFYRGEPHVYAVPKASGSNAVFSASLWIAGLVNGDARAAAGQYGLKEYAPGPVVPGAVGSAAARCAAWDRLFEVTDHDYREAAAGRLTANVLDWPWQAGAPVLDGDGIPDNYDPLAGDLPELIGTQRLWWVMNDVDTSHDHTDSDPLGIEVHGSAMARPSIEQAVDQATLWRFRVINRSEHRIDQAWLGFFLDTDLGDFADDYIGIDTTLGLAFTYNGDNEDIGGEGYGTAPPAFGVTLLEDAPADDDGLDNDLDGRIDEPGERVGLGHFMPHTWNPCITCDPNPPEVYENLSGRWWDGTPVVHGGNGHRSDAPGARPTRHIFPGDPVTRSFWSEVNVDSLGGSKVPGDRKWVVSAGPFRLEPTGEITFTWAMVFARGLDHLDSITQLRRAARGLQGGTQFLLRPASRFDFAPVQPERFDLGMGVVHPNPADERAALDVSLPTTMPVRLTLVDLLGRERAVLVDGEHPAGRFRVAVPVSTLQAGVYFVRLVAGRAVRTQKLAVVR